MALSRSGRSGRSDLLWCTRGAVVEHHRDLGEVVEGQRASAIEVCKPRQHRFDRKRDAIQTFTAFLMKGAADENVAAIGRDRQGWIDQQTERLKRFEIEESEPEPTGRPPYLRRVK